MDIKQRELIEEIIKQHPDYIGHENLIDQFCAEIYKKSYLLLDSVSNIESLKNYLTKVADTSIANVLKNLPKEENDALSKINKLPDIPDITVETKVLQHVVQKQPEPIQMHNSMPNVEKRQEAVNKDPYSGLIDPEEFFNEKQTNPLVAKNIIDVIDMLDLGNPDKKYLEIFTMRYVQNMHQGDIAKKLKISQADLSMRFCDLVKLIKQHLY